MNIEMFQEIWQTISRNKTRSFLTAFGVFWGIFMFVFLIGMGTAIQSGLMAGVSGSTKNSMMIFSDRTSVEYKGFNAGRYWNLTSDDALAIRRQFPQVEYVSSNIFCGEKKISFREHSQSFSVRGIDQFTHLIDPQLLLAGRYINAIDINEKRKVCVIGKEICDKLFGTPDSALNKRISIDDRYFVVAGVVNSSGKINMGGKASNTVFIPLTVGQQIYNYGNQVHTILLSAYNTVDISTIEPFIKNLLKSKHLIAPDDATAIGTFNVQKTFMMFQNLFLGLNILIWIVGMGTLFAGVVGVSNIMLITVKERTKEIGIRRAIGANPNVIIRQILSESTFLTFVAGFFGLLFALGILVAADHLMAKSFEMMGSPIISFRLAVVSVIILVITGAVAGIIPAKNAIKIKPIDALRDE